MDELVKGVFTALVATLFIVSGMIFFLIAVIGNISGKIEPGLKARIISGIFGLVFILVGVSMHVMQSGLKPLASPTASPTLTKPDQSAAIPQTITPPSGTGASNDLKNIEKFQPASQALDAVHKPATIMTSASTNWVPTYPADKIDLSLRDSSAQRQLGSFSLKTQDDPSDVLNFYEARFKIAGFEIERSYSMGYIIAKSASNGRTITVNTSTQTKDHT